MVYHLFDSPRLGLLIALLIEIVLFLAWSFTNGRIRKLYLLVGPVLAGLFILIDVIVQTNREQLEMITCRIVQAAEDENAPGIISHISDNFLLDNGFDKMMAARAIETKLAKPLIANNNISNLRVTRAEDTTGQVEFKVTTTLDPKSRYALIPVVTTFWRFDYARSDNQPFKVRNMTMLWLIPGIVGQKKSPINVFTYR
ncbi:MAG: hypothetical protein KAT56_08105 [Sedimentisphaerales bacterium]|nr:hypothetical protein [Sedimentisphaerales bacterium]